ncbi:AMP-binding protein [Streptomyces sp. NPDC002817]|uniref:AMP-binding protein n=1 Tax=Streptomyces sp. NPDC088357 TaxID=3154655 RepID=UPI0034383A3E
MGSSGSAPAPPLTGLLGPLRPPADVVRTFTDRGWWREETLLHDLYRGAASHPHRTAIVSHRTRLSAGRRVTRLSYAQLAAVTDRFAYALDALGTRPADPVAFQLPNRWETCALLLACWRVGAVAVPVMPGYGARDLHAVLSAAEARFVVVPDVWEGTEPARALASLAPRLPWLRHRVVLGNAVYDGAVDLVRHFVDTPHERYGPPGRLRMPPAAADRVGLAVTSLGLRAAHSMALHSANTLYANLAPSDERDAAPVAFSAVPLASLPSLLHTVIRPLSLGGTVVLQDVWDPEAALGVMDAAQVSQTYATPAQWAELVAARERGRGEAVALDGAFTSDPAGTPAALARQVSSAFGAWPGALPAGRAGGRAASPLAVWRRESAGLTPAWEPADADAAHVEEIGGVFLVPVTEIEALLRVHPRVAEAAVVARSDPLHGELACAVVVPDGDPPGLLDLREHLRARGVRPAHLPAELTLLGGLPRTASGEPDRGRLRDLLAREATRAA